MISSRNTSLSRSVDRITGGVLGGFALVSGGVVVLILGHLLAGAWPALVEGFPGDFLTGTKWQPGSEKDPRFGILAMLAGSFLVALLALVLALPVALASAIFHRFYAPPLLKRWHRRGMELLIGVPSVIFGFWGLTVVVPAIVRVAPGTPGQSLLAGGIVLGLMILPLVALTSHASLEAVPKDQLEAAAGLGLGRARTIGSIALPAARGGIASGVLLAFARAIGETMAVVLVCGNIPQLPGSLFDPIRPVTSTIALEMGYATATHRALLYGAGLVLLVITGILVAWASFRKNDETPDPDRR